MMVRMRWSRASWREVHDSLSLTTPRTAVQRPSCSPHLKTNFQSASVICTLRNTMKLYRRNSRPISFFFSQATAESYLLRKNEKLLSCVAGISVDLLRIGRVELLASSHTCAMCGCCQRRRVVSAHLVHEDDHTISRCKPYKQVYNTFHPYNRDTITLLTNYAHSS